MTLSSLVIIRTLFVSIAVFKRAARPSLIVQSNESLCPKLTASNGGANHSFGGESACFISNNGIIVGA
jgi:hypothetical protein